MLGLLVFILIGAILFGVVLFVASYYSIWLSIGIYAVVMILLFLCNRYLVGYAGGSDPAGNGMERGFLGMFYYASMIMATIVLLVNLVLWFYRR